MKPITSLSRNVVTALAICSLLGAVAASAQSTPKASPEKKTPYSLEIEDGRLMLPDRGDREATLESVVERLRELELEQNGVPVNIVLSPELPQIRVTNLKLGATTLDQELEALSVACGQKFFVNPGGPDQEPAVFYLMASPNLAKAQLQVEAFSLSGYLESKRKTADEDEHKAMIDNELEQLVRIVDETTQVYMRMNKELNGRDSSPHGTASLRFHRGANLLIVMGEPEAVGIAAKVISALPGVQRSGGSGEFGYGGGGGAFDPFAFGKGRYTGGYGGSRTLEGAQSPFSSPAPQIDPATGLPKSSTPSSDRR